MNLVERFPDIKLTDGSGCQTAIQLLINAEIGRVESTKGLYR
jgi:hypothetical protein